MNASQVGPRAWSLLGMWLGPRWILLLMALTAPVLALVRTELHGVALHGDSVTYIAVARNLTAGMGFTHFDGTPLTGWAPLYPALIALIDLALGVQPLSGARFFDAAAFGLIVFLSGLLFQRYLNEPFLVVVGTAFVLLSPDMLRLSTYGLSEPFFILLTIVFLLGLNRYLNKNSLLTLLLTALAVGLAGVTRYMGVTLILAGAVAILVNGRCSVRTRILHLLLFCAIASLPLALWALRNIQLTGLPTASRGPSKYPLHYNLYYTFVFHLNWFFPVYFIGVTATSRGALAVLAAVSGYLAGALLKPRDLLRWSRLAAWQLDAVSIFYITYVSFLVALATTFGLERIGYRYLSPAFVPVVLIILYLMEQELFSAGKTISFALLGSLIRIPRSRLVIAALVAVFAMAAVREVVTIARPVEPDNNVNHFVWQSSETIQLAKSVWLSQGEETPLYSNVPFALYVHAGIPARWVPAAHRHQSSEPRKPVTSLAGLWPESPKAFLVWFDAQAKGHLFGVESLREIADFKTVARLEDGTVYEVSSR